MKKIINIFFYCFLFIMPPLWVLVWNSYCVWNEYRKENRVVPNNFFVFLYYHNFDYTYKYGHKK